MRYKLLAAVLAAAVASPVLAASKDDFHTCDNLSTPGKGGESGMGPPPTIGGFAFGGAVNAKALVAACTAALADPRLQPRQTLRRAHLLRARALAQLEAGDADAALNDLNAAIAAAGPLNADPLFARSMGASFELIRAAALLAKGDRVEARRLAASAAARRPYSASIQTAAAIIAQRARDLGAPDGLTFTQLIAIEPNALTLQFLSDVEAGRFAAAAALYPRLKPPVSDPNPFLNLNDQLGPIVIASAAGYAFAATGEPARARAIMTAAKTRLDAAFAPRNDPKGKPLLLPLAQLAAPLQQFLERGNGLVEARIAIAEHHPLDALKLLVGRELPVSDASVELLTALRAALPADQRGLAPDPVALADKLAEQRKAETLDVARLRKSMPAPETTRNLADYQKAQSGFLYSFFAGSGASSDGFKAKTDAQTGITKVEFVGNASSLPTVEELTLLRAADLARQAGKKGVLIVERHDYTRTMQMTQGYSRIPVSSTPAGYKTELEVRFVDPAALPADLAGERARVLDADTVWKTLAPVYIPAPAPAAATK